MSPVMTTIPPHMNLVHLAHSLWYKCRREAILSMYTPFCLGLLAGTLDIHTFRLYINQDVHFLNAFQRAYELAAENADDDDAKYVINKLRNAVTEELKMHASFVKEWAAENGKESNVSPATLKYTEFLLATASGKIEVSECLVNLATPFDRTKLAAYTLGAMTPCMRLYAFLAKEFKAALGADYGDHPYKTWIENYASRDFEAEAERTEDVLERLSATLTGEELNTIEKLYHQAMKLELEFFYSQPVPQKTVVPLINYHNPKEDRLVFFYDFDMTCTTIDSSAELDPNQLAEDQDTCISSADLRKPWYAISKQYMEGYAKCINRITPPQIEEFNHETLCKAIEQLSDGEKIANRRVDESELLKNIREAGEQLVIQDGCFDFFGTASKIENLNLAINIVSYCWCEDYIRSSLKSGGVLSEVSIHANEFIFEESVSTGDLVRKVESPSPIDKVVVFRKIMESYGNDRKNFTVYVGDSIGDILCLLEADIGIVFGIGSSLIRVGTQFGVSFVPLYEEVVRKQKGHTEATRWSWEKLPGVLYTVNNWAEIHAFVLGCF